MIEVKLAHQPFWENNVEGYFALIAENFDSCSIIKKIEQDFYPHLREILKKHKFEGKKGQSYVLSALHNGKLIQLIFVGVGKLADSQEIELENLRRAVGTCTQIMKRLELENATLALPSQAMFNIDQAELLKQFTIVCYLADYDFIKFKTEKKEDRYNGILYLAPKENAKHLEEALKEGTIIAKAANYTRHLADMPPNFMTPIVVATHAQTMAHEHNLNCTILDTKAAADAGMGGFLAVQVGSENEGRVVVLEYKTQQPNAKTIALVGKGITFDSGGISLKPSANMTGMKYDMSGAAAVIGTMRAIAQLKPNVNVVGITPLAENMPSGKATRQDDIVTFMNGKTAEIKNTDAEGRLILADALCYVEKNYSPDVIIDIATLTGACVISLGLYYTGLMSKNNELAEELISVGKKCGEQLWRLPLSDDYEAAIKSDVADLANCGKPEYGAGTITAGMFLQHFVEKTPYAHLDIAGTSDGVLGVNYIGRGATGIGVRLFVEFIMGYQKRRK